MEYRITTICGLAIILIAVPVFADECSDFRAALNVREAIADALNAHARDGGSVNDEVYQAMSERYRSAADEYYLVHQSFRNSIDDSRDKDLSEQFNAANIAMQQAFMALGKSSRKHSDSLRDIALTAVESADKADAAVQLAIGCQSKAQ